ncbi:methyltransferase domain-containing protein [Streptomyces tanashiensis]|uniref:methyltransferase domain-containing protein n=1 Tax=Streptomyces tanashiensis TaxID=67367 RepID=UPI0033F81114
MTTRTHDGSAGDVDHGATSTGDAFFRRPDERIARFIAGSLGEARSVLHVGAGAGSYENVVGAVTAVGPSEDLPFADGAFDAAMTLFSVHQWSDVTAGLREMRRVTRGPVTVLTCDPALVRDFWLYAYAPEVLDTEARRFPPVSEIAAALGGTATVAAVPIPLDCTDGFNEAYYGRPELLLVPAARQACSAWSFVDDRTRERFDRTLRHDLVSGAWDARFGRLRAQAIYRGSLVVVRALP